MNSARISQIEPSDVLDMIAARKSNPSQLPLTIAGIDVRSEGEVRDGAIPSFTNIPILNDDERHQVGLCYKQNGQNAAVELGHRLVDSHKDHLIEKWCAHLKSAAVPVVTCWRGGLRSKTAADWIASTGQPVSRVNGGTKALRNELLRELECLPRLLVVTGPTGSGKTNFLSKARHPHVDLEKWACHRGSAFGAYWDRPQPSQITFENEVALEFRKIRKSENLEKLDRASWVLVEDESRSIGRIHLPLSIVRGIEQAPVVRITADLQTRVRNILDEYVLAPLRAGLDAPALFDLLATNLARIQPKLGGQTYATILECMRGAFEHGDHDRHCVWIQLLLEKYYDKAYAYSATKRPREVAFEGDESACLKWIESQNPSA